MARIGRSGYYAWDIEENTVWVDRDLGLILGVSEQDADTGFDISRFLAVLHPEDIERVAKHMHDSIIGGLPYHLTYRIVRGGKTLFLRGEGRCFRRRGDSATLAAGWIEEVDSDLPQQ